MPLKNLFTALLGLWLFGWPVAGQSQPRQFTFEEAARTALKENVDLRTQQHQLSFVKAQRLQAFARMAPTASIFSAVERVNGNQFILEIGQLLNTTTESFWTGLNADVTVFNGFRIVNSLRAANLNHDAQEQLVKRSGQDVVFNVAQQYLQVLLDQELLRIANENLTAQLAQLENTKNQVESGLMAIPDQYTQQAEASRLKSLVLQSENTLLNDKALFAQLLQLEPSEDFELLPPSWDTETMMAKQFLLDELLADARIYRPDVAQAGLLAEAAQRNILVAKAAYTPTLSAYYAYRSFWTSANDARNFNEQFGTDNIRSVMGISLNIPLFGGLQNRTQYFAAKTERDNALLVKQNLEKTTAVEVRRNYQNFLFAKENLMAAHEQVAAALQSHETQEELLRLGQNNALNVAQANNTLMIAKANLQQARFQLLFQEIMLAYSTGTLDLGAFKD